MAFTRSGLFLGNLTVTFIKHVDPENPDPMTADYLNIVPSYNQFEDLGDKTTKFQETVDDLIAIFEPHGWQFQGASAENLNTSGGAFTPTA